MKQSEDAEHSYLGWSKMIDHALLKPQTTQEQLEAGIAVVKTYRVASVCIFPYAVPWAREQLEGTGVLTTTTIGFPHGAHTTRTKEAEAKEALKNGAEELDMVINISRVKSGDFQYVRDDIRAVLDAVRAENKRLKVIFEMAYLEEQEKLQVAQVCSELGVDWVKTSTGFASGGATEADVQLLRKTVSPSVQVKAAGGIQTFAQLAKMRELGATRCGASRTAHILEEVRRSLGLPRLSDVDTLATTDTDQRY